MSLVLKKYTLSPNTVTLVDNLQTFIKAFDKVIDKLEKVQTTCHNSKSSHIYLLRYLLVSYLAMFVLT